MTDVIVSRDGVLHILPPEKLNAFTEPMVDTAAAVECAGEDPVIRASLLTGRGGAGIQCRCRGREDGRRGRDRCRHAALAGGLGLISAV